MSSIQGYKMKEYSMPTKRYCQTLSLKNNPILIEEYRKIHSEEKGMAGNKGGDTCSRDSGNGNLYIGITTFYDYRNSTGL